MAGPSGGSRAAAAAGSSSRSRASSATTTRYDGSFQRRRLRQLIPKATSGRTPARAAAASHTSKVVPVPARVAGDVVGGDHAHVVEPEGREARIREHARLLLADAQLEAPRGAGMTGAKRGQGAAENDGDDGAHRPPMSHGRRAHTRRMLRVVKGRTLFEADVG